MSDRTVDVLIATSLQPELVEVIAAVDERIRVHYAPELLPTPRYACDHNGVPPELSAGQRQRWLELLAAAEVSFGLDWSDPAGMPVNCPRLRWAQGTSAGMGGYLSTAGLLAAPFAVTTAAGVHGAPLAEFALAGVLHFVKDVPRLLDHQGAHRWERHISSMAAGRRALVVGLGGIGREVVRLFTALGLPTRGVSRAGRADGIPGLLGAVPFTGIDAELPETDVLVLCCPLTPQTTGLIDKDRLALLPPGAIVVNLARGPVLDEPALIEALSAGRLGGACLDVAGIEPLPADSALWEAPNLLLSPHSAANVVEENARIVELFAANLRRYLGGQPLLNLFDAGRGY